MPRFSIVMRIPFSERHLEIAVQPARRCDGHHGRAVRRIFSIAVSKLLIIRTPENALTGASTEGFFAAVPIAAHHEAVPRVSCKPDVRHHARSLLLPPASRSPPAQCRCMPAAFRSPFPRVPLFLVPVGFSAENLKLFLAVYRHSSMSLPPCRLLSSLYYSNSNPALQQNTYLSIQASVFTKATPGQTRSPFDCLGKKITSGVSSTGNGDGDGRADHGVVAHADQAHHLNVRGHGGGTRRTERRSAYGPWCRSCQEAGRRPCCRDAGYEPVPPPEATEKYSYQPDALFL